MTRIDASDGTISAALGASGTGRAIVYLHGVGGPMSRKKFIKHLGTGLKKVKHLDDDPWVDALTIPSYIPELKRRRRAGRPLRDLTWSFGSPTTPQDAEEYLQRSAAVRLVASQYRKNPGRWRPSGTGKAVDKVFGIVASIAHGGQQGTIAVSWPIRRALKAMGKHEFLRAGDYLGSRTTRHRVLSAVLDQWPTESRVLVIAHSLGSVVLVDLLGRLPEGAVVDVITVGSPLAGPGFRRRARRLNGRFPYSRVNSWVNVRDPNDLVAWSGGLSHLLPGVVDVKVDTDGSHDAPDYLRRKPVAAMVASFLCR